MRDRVPSLKKLAAEIEKRFPDLVVEFYPASHPLGGYASTDRDIPGTRLRHPGKGRKGSLLVVRKKSAPSELGGGTGSVVFRHNAAETYRHNGDVVDWILDRVRNQAYFEIVGTPHYSDRERTGR
jgi:hypothetical protein